MDQRRLATISPATEVPGIGDCLRHTYQLGKPWRRNLTLVSAYQADCRKPFGQWQTSGLKIRLIRRRNLPTALGALVQMTVLQLSGLVVTAFRADESIYSAVPVQFFQTSRLSRVLLCSFKKFGKVPLHSNFPAGMLNQVVTLHYNANYYNSLTYAV